MEKCTHCQSTELVDARLGAMGGVIATQLKENGKAKISASAGVYGKLCTKCGTISRIFVKEEYLSKFKAKTESQAD